MKNPLGNYPYKIILASKSPRRQQLLKGLDIDFEIEVREIDEVYPDNLVKEEIPIYLSELKAAAFENSIMDKEMTITSDTIVWLNGKVLEKPRSPEQAKEMLQKLSNNCHTVYTGVCLKTNKKQITFSDRTKVFFKKIKSNEIDYYLSMYQPYDKAGSYGIQEWLGYANINKIEGCYFNVMGLPLPKLYSELLNFIK